MEEKRQIKIKWQIQIKKIILFEQAYDEIKFIFAKFQDESTATGMEGETLTREFARVWGKDIDENHYIDREV